MNNNKHPKKLLWIDLETSGLEPLNDHILEIALLITDQAGNEIDHFSQVIYFDPINQDWLDEAVFQMHSKSGLLEDCAASNCSVHQAEQLALEFLEKHQLNGCGPMGGNSPHFDRGFLTFCMPDLLTHFNHRSFDMSTLKMFLEICGHQLPEALESKNAVHRALPDIRRSTSIYRDCLRMMPKSFKRRALQAIVGMLA